MRNIWAFCIDAVLIRMQFFLEHSMGGENVVHAAIQFLMEAQTSMAGLYARRFASHLAFRF